VCITTIGSTPGGTHLHTNSTQNTDNGTTYHHFIEHNSKMEKEAANVDEEKARLQTQLSPKRIGIIFTAILQPLS
jgi:hypothetical protein